VHCSEDVLHPAANIPFVHLRDKHPNGHGKVHRRKVGTGHHLGPDLVILPGHGFNSSAAPPLGSRLSFGFVGIPVAIAIGSSCFRYRLLLFVSPTADRGLRT
jgi:hypothetical protein